MRTGSVTQGAPRRAAVRGTRRAGRPAGRVSRSAGRTPRVFVWLHADSVEVGVAGGAFGERWRGAAAALDRSLSHSMDAETYDAHGDLLPAVLDEAGASGRGRAIVIYDSRTGVGELSGGAESAAIAQRQVSVAAAGQVDPTRGVVTAGAGFEERGVPGEGPSYRAIGAAEEMPAVEVVTSVCESAGLKVAGVLPSRAWLLGHAARLSLAMIGPLEGEREERAEAVLVLYRHGAAIAAGRGGRLEFARSLETGYEQLVQGFARGASRSSIRMSEVDEAAGNAAGRSRELVTKARQSLFRAGIPGRNDVLSGFEHLHGRDVLPAVQPVLQRLLIEVRQTLRFGTVDEAMTPRRLRIAGPGAEIPGLADLLADGLDMPVIPVEERARRSGPFAGSAASELQSDASQTVGLVPVLEAPKTKQMARSRRAGRAMVAGSLLALTLAGLDASRTMSALREARAERRAHADELDGLVSFNRQSALALEAGSVVMEVLRVVDGEVGRLPVWGAVLRDLGDTNVEGWELIEVSGSLNRQTGRLEVTGLTSSGDGSGRGTVGQLLEAMSERPLIGEPSLGGTRVEDLGGPRFQRFTIRAETPTLSPREAAWLHGRVGDGRGGDGAIVSAVDGGGDG